jgi:hypothetical protein
MLKQGYASVSAIAKAIQKPRCFLYRLWHSGYINAVHEGTFVYLSLTSLKTYYAGNSPMLAALEQLRQTGLQQASVVKSDEGK